MSKEEFDARNELMRDLQPDGKTPFIFTPIKCPICSKESVQKYFKSDAFKAEGKGIDLRPLKFNFIDSDFEAIHPPLYSVWQCPSCKFCGEDNTFENPVEYVVGSMNNFRKRLLENYQTNETFKKVLVALSGGDEDEHDFFTSIKQYLIAIYQLESIVSVRERDALSLARLCIHLAWLYQDLDENSQKTSTKILVDQVKYSIIFDWPRAPLDAKSALKLALHYYEVTFYESSVLKDKHIDHNILQIIGRLHIVLDDIEEGRKVILKSIMVANKYRQDYEAKLKAKDITPAIQEQYLPKVHLIDEFVRDTQDLLFESKKMLKKEK